MKNKETKVHEEKRIFKRSGRIIRRCDLPQIESTFSARVTGKQGITVLDGIEC